jgi:D-glycero-D-manno-heptose 1,7-bisphosphate phosphatase
VKALLLDRDGVLNVDLPGSVLSLADLIVMRSARAPLERLRDQGWTIAVCTNQACVGRGHLNHDDLRMINEHISRDLGDTITKWYICPHRGDEGCACRKPKPGLLVQAQRELGFDPAHTWFLGDSAVDVEAATAAGCRPALVLTGKGAQSSQARPDVPVFSDLAAFATMLQDSA